MRNIGRPKPSAVQLSHTSAFLTRRTADPSVPTPGAPSPQNDQYRAEYKPDFLKKPERANSSLETPAEPRRQSITEQYELARQQLTNPAPVQGYATEKQRRDYAWQVRSDPRGAAETARQHQQMYNRTPTPSSPTVNRPANFKGPRPRFTP